MKKQKTMALLLIIWMIFTIPSSALAQSADALYQNGLAYAEAGNYEVAAQIYEIAANQGSAAAQNALGELYYLGNGVAKSNETAVKYFKMAADQGLMEGYLNLGDMYLYGIGVDKSYSLAMKYYQLAADQGSAEGLNELGDMYRMGWSVDKDLKKAIDYYLQALDAGYPLAANSLAISYEELEDYEKAAEYRALSGNDYQAAVDYEKAGDYESAIKYYDLVGDVGYEDAQKAIARLNSQENNAALSPARLLYQSAEEAFDREDYKTAFTYFEAAAAMGDSDAQDELGYMYREGLGVAQDNDKAIYYFELSAAQGNGSGLNDLGYLYLEGIGVDQDYQKALDYFERAVDSGYVYANMWLGQMYVEGTGVEQSFETAAKYFRVAAEDGDEDAQYFLDLMLENGVISNASVSVTATPTPKVIVVNNVVYLNTSTPTPQANINIPTPQPTAVPASKSQLYGNGRQVQDPYNFARGEVTFGEDHEGSGGVHIRDFKGDKDDLSIVKKYVSLLDSMDFPFKINKVHEDNFEAGHSMFLSQPAKTYYSATLNYTGSEKGIGSTISQTYETNYSGNIMIYCSVEGNNLKGSIWISSGLEYADLGLRLDGSIETLQKTGQSSSSGLKEIGGIIFQTEDGRLTTFLDQATILRDGVEYSTEEVSLYRNREKSKEEIRISGYYRDEWLAFTVPYDSLMTGDELTERDMNVDRTLNEFQNNMEWAFGWRPEYLFAAGHGGKGLFAHTDPINDLEKVQINVLLWDTDRDIAVFYIACEFSKEPYDVEVLAAMVISGVSPNANNAGTYTVNTGSTLSVTNSSRADGSSYDVYSWEILEGSKYIELTGTKSQTVQVKGTAKGTARIRGIYEYGVTEPDVLTGNPHTVNKVVSNEYVINVE